MRNNDATALQPPQLKDRLVSDLEFAQHPLRKDCEGFLKHTLRLAEAFQLVYAGPPKKKKKTDDPPTRSGNQDKFKSKTPDPKYEGKGDDGKKRPPPLCLWEPHAKKGIRHFLKECPECPETEKKRLLDTRAKKLAEDGPAKGTRFGGRPPPGRTTVRLRQGPVNLEASPSCVIVVSDGLASLNGKGRCDDGSDDSIASPVLAQNAVLKGIGRFEAIKPVSIQVALTNSQKAESFNFSRIWKVPRLVMELSAGRLALTNVSFLVADDDLACEDLLLGLPVLRHLGIDSRTLLERNLATLDGTDCATVKHLPSADRCGSLGRLMIDRFEGSAEQEGLQSDDESVTDGDCEVDQSDSPQLDPDRPRQDYFAQSLEEDPFPDPNLIGLPSSHVNTSTEEIQAMLDTAKKNGFPESHATELEKLVWKHREVFSPEFQRVPAKIDPLRIELTPDARPIRVKLRNYSQSQREFMTNMTDELTQYGLIFPNPTSKWACAPLLVPKPGPAEWRFTVDLKPVNQFTKPYQFPMPIVEQELVRLAGSKFFANFDFALGYWQMPLHPDSQECQSFFTHENVFTPTRVLHGTTNAVLHLQSFLAMNLPPDLKNRTLLWVDDSLLFQCTIEEHLADIESFLNFCVSHNWKLHPLKCTLFATTVKWCGRIISEEGISHDPSNVAGLTHMEEPTTGSQWQVFLCAMQWLRSSIPDFQSLVQRLQDKLELVYVKERKRTKRAAARVRLSDIGWDSEDTTAFEACKHAIVHRATLAHRDSRKRLCIYTDASDSHWSGILTQVPYTELSLPHADQPHEALAFHSGRFTKTQLGWSTVEKETFAVLATVERSHWLAMCADGFDLYTDHNNLIFIFDPLSVMPDLGQTAIRKVLRWAVRLSAYNYVCFHISGEDNVWADLLTRWTTPFTIRRLVKIPPLPTTFENFEWPNIDIVLASQNTHSASRPEGLSLCDGAWHDINGSIWIPDEDDPLQLRLAIIDHTGVAGHRGCKATESAFRKEFWWTTLTEDVELLVTTCIHCLSTTGGEKVPRPYGPSLHGTAPNDLIQFDYIYMRNRPTGEKYILMVRDDHSGYCWFYPAVTTDAETAANALIDWSAAFGAPMGLMSDGPTHFKNETVRLLARGLRTPHHFTLPYCPWSNGAVERLGKELLRAARALLSELQMRQDGWPQLVPVFQSILNNAPSPQRNDLAPITIFTGRPATPPISTFLQASDCQAVTLSKAVSEKALNVAALVKFMDELHPIIDSHLTEKRERMRDTKAKGEPANFTEGDFVLAAREDFFEVQKLCLRWRGPRRVVKAISDYVYRVEDLRNGVEEDIHATRLKFYSDQSLDEKLILSHILSSETGMPISRLLRLVEKDGDYFVAVRWKVLEKSDDTLEPISGVYEDVPKLFGKLLNRANTPVDMRDKVRAALGL